MTPQPKGENSSAANNSTSNRGSSFSCKQTLCHSFTRADSLLPQIPNKKNWSYPKAFDKLQIKNKLKDEKIWLIEFWTGVM